MTIPYFYAREGDGFVPTRLAASPWERGKQNGVALGGLLTHLIEGVATPVPMTTVRLTIDILSAAPLGPTTGSTRIVREGKRIQMVEAHLTAGDRIVARATALRVRIADTPVFDSPMRWPAPEECAPVQFMHPSAFGGMLETRHVAGALREPGPGTLWVRFGHQHVEGVPLTPLVRAAMLGDFGGGLGSMVSVAEWRYANLDIALHLSREPEGERLLIDAVTDSAGNGVARADMTLADRRGPFARVHQTLFIAAQD